VFTAENDFRGNAVGKDAVGVRDPRKIGVGVVNQRIAQQATDSLLGALFKGREVIDDTGFFNRTVAAEIKFYLGLLQGSPRERVLFKIPYFFLEPVVIRQPMTRCRPLISAMVSGRSNSACSK
jgi:hypothetical protein